MSKNIQNTKNAINNNAGNLINNATNLSTPQKPQTNNTAIGNKDQNKGNANKQLDNDNDNDHHEENDQKTVEKPKAIQDIQDHTEFAITKLLSSIKKDLGNNDLPFRNSPQKQKKSDNAATAKKNNNNAPNKNNDNTQQNKTNAIQQQVNQNLQQNNDDQQHHDDQHPDDHKDQEDQHDNQEHHDNVDDQAQESEEDESQKGFHLSKLNGSLPKKDNFKIKTLLTEQEPRYNFIDTEKIVPSRFLLNDNLTSGDFKNIIENRIIPTKINQINCQQNFRRQISSNPERIINQKYGGPLYHSRINNNNNFLNYPQFGQQLGYSSLRPSFLRPDLDNISKGHSLYQQTNSGQWMLNSRLVQNMYYNNNPFDPYPCSRFLI